MGLYVEVMCDARIQGRGRANVMRMTCWSDENDNPQGRSVGTARANARQAGWHLIGRRRAICPRCWEMGARHP